MADGVVVDRADSLPGGAGTDIDASELWLLPALYDADAHLPVDTLGLRASDIYASMLGGVVNVNVAMQFQEIKDADLERVVADLSKTSFPRIVPILSVHSDMASDGFGAWLKANVDVVKGLMPPVCKLYSYSANFWSNLESVFAAGLLPVIYCSDLEAVDSVVERAQGPVHFRHAISDELVYAMKKLPGATLQTSPHFLVPIEAERRAALHVLPPVPGDDVRQSLADVFLDEIDLLVSDHNAPPFGIPDGPGLQVEHSFLSSILTATTHYGWPLEKVWTKATTGPAERYGVELGSSWVVVDPAFSEMVGLWPPRQTPDRAPYLGRTMQGRVVAIGTDESATLL
jgi:hypothetical protein